MNNIDVIVNQEIEGKNFKVYGTVKNPLFLAKDVAEFIGHTDRVKMVKYVDEGEKVKKIVKTLGGNQCMWFLTEEGLYEVLMQSRKPVAKSFKKEVKKILKSIRKDGMYVRDNVLDIIMDNPEIAIEMLKRIESEREEGKKLRKELEAQKPYVCFAKSALDRNMLLSIEEFSHLLKQYGVEIGEKKLIKWFKDNSYLIKKNGLESNMPVQKAINMELFKVVDNKYQKEDGRVYVKKDTMITGKGQLYFMDKLLSKDKEN